MTGRHRFGRRDAPVRTLLTAAVPVVAVAGMTVAVLVGGGSPATSEARIEVPAFAPSTGVPEAASPPLIAPLPAPSSPAAAPAALASALPAGTPAVLDVSGDGSSAVRRIRAERAEAAERAREAAREREAARDRAAAQAAAEQERQKALRAAQPRPGAGPTPTPRVTPSPQRTATPARPTPPPNRSLLDLLLGSRGN